MKKILKVGGAISLLAAGVFVADDQGWIFAPEAMQVTASRCSLATVVSRVDAEGKLAPETEVPLSSDVSGEVVELAVQEGQRVRKGQLLLRVRPDTYQAIVGRQAAGAGARAAGVAQAEAQLRQQTLTSAQAGRDYARQATLFEQKVISRADFEAAEAAQRSAQAQLLVYRAQLTAARGTLASARAELQQASKDLEKTAIYAPVAGVVSRLYVQLGERVVGTAQRPGTPLLRLAEPGVMEVVVGVNESEISQVLLGDSAEVTLSAGGSRQPVLRGVVTRVAPQATESARVRAVDYEVRVRVLSPGGANSPLRAGMGATVGIVTARKANVLTVPLAAVTTRIRGAGPALPPVESGIFDDDGPEGGRVVEPRPKGKPQRDIIVFVIRGDRAIRTPVKVGINDMYHMEILSGLPAGALVATGPYRSVNRWLSQGSTVEVKAAGEITKLSPFGQ